MSSMVMVIVVQGVVMSSGKETKRKKYQCCENLKVRIYNKCNFIILFKYVYFIIDILLLNMKNYTNFIIFLNNKEWPHIQLKPV